ncbi:unnamed protein product, partial [Ascophyllum nodosum]
SEEPSSFRWPLTSSCDRLLLLFVYFQESIPYPPANVCQALMTTVSRKAASA